MNQNELMIGGTLIYAGVILFFLLEHSSTEFWQTLRTFGILILIVGVIIFIIGLVTKRKRNETLQPPKDRNCLNCGKAIPFEASICPYCKMDFEQVELLKTSQ